MTITSKKAELESTAAAASYALPSFTPSANAVLVVTIDVTGIGAPDQATVADSGMGLTWTKFHSTDLTLGHEVFGFWALAPASPSATVVTYTTNAGSGSYCFMTAYEVDGGDPIAPIVQSRLGTGTGNDPTLAFSSALDANNSYLAIAVKDTTAASFTAQSGWTRDIDGVYNGGGPDKQCSAQHRDGDESTTLSVVFDFAGGSVAWIELIIEVAAVSAGGIQAVF